MSTIYSYQFDICRTGRTRNQADICRELSWIVVIPFSQMFHCLCHARVDCISIQHSNMCCRQQANRTARVLTRSLYYSSSLRNTAVWECNTNICIGSIRNTFLTTFRCIPLEVCTCTTIISSILFEQFF